MVRQTASSVRDTANSGKSTTMLPKGRTARCETGVNTYLSPKGQGPLGLSIQKSVVFLLFINCGLSCMKRPIILPLTVTKITKSQILIFTQRGRISSWR